MRYKIIRALKIIRLLSFIYFVGVIHGQYFNPIPLVKPSGLPKTYGISDALPDAEHADFDDSGFN